MGPLLLKSDNAHKQAAAQCSLRLKLDVLTAATWLNWDSRMCNNATLHACRLAGGIESPEIAKKILETGSYPLIPPMDVWALGQMLLELTDSCQPPSQRHFTTSPEFKQELDASLDANDSNSPWQLQHLQYLADLCKPEIATTAYADQVHMPACCVIGRF